MAAGDRSAGKRGDGEVRATGRQPGLGRAGVEADAGIGHGRHGACRVAGDGSRGMRTAREAAAAGRVADRCGREGSPMVSRQVPNQRTRQLEMPCLARTTRPRVVSRERFHVTLARRAETHRLPGPLRFDPSGDQGPLLAAVRRRPRSRPRAVHPDRAAPADRYQLAVRGAKRPAKRIDDHETLCRMAGRTPRG